jgi:hypothetical protein
VAHFGAPLFSLQKFLTKRKAALAAVPAACKKGHPFSDAPELNIFRYYCGFLSCSFGGLFAGGAGWFGAACGAGWLFG